LIEASLLFCADHNRPTDNKLKNEVHSSTRQTAGAPSPKAPIKFDVLARLAGLIESSQAVIGPELILPSEWSTMNSDARHPRFVDEAEGKAILRTSISRAMSAGDGGSFQMEPI
jgi:hypothetical protein